MKFVYIHAVIFALWMLVFEKSPWPTLTLDRLARGDLPLDVRDDRSEPTSGVPAGKGRRGTRTSTSSCSRTRISPGSVHELTQQVHDRVIGRFGVDNDDETHTPLTAIRTMKGPKMMKPNFLLEDDVREELDWDRLSTTARSS